MAIPAGLIAKSLVGVGTAAAATTLGVVYKDNISNFFSSVDIKTLGERVGLECNDSETEGECTFKESASINVWKEAGDYITEAQVTGSNKKMKFSKSQEVGNFGFKFTVENDITLTGGTKIKGENGISKLTKENKTYEIGLRAVGGTEKWFLIEK